MVVFLVGFIFPRFRVKILVILLLIIQTFTVTILGVLITFFSQEKGEPGENPQNLSKVTDKCYHIKCYYQVHLSTWMGY